MAGIRWAAVLLPALALSACLLRQGQRYESFSIPRPLEAEPCLVLGFLGGRASWDADNRSVRKTALALRRKGVPVETVENSKKDLAMRLIREAFDRNRDGSLDAAEADRVKLILYGHSFGGAAVVELARRLEERSIPVRLTIQVDSVGFRDERIPANVAKAANLYQRNGWFIKGEPTVRAADPDRTRILGNWRYDYSDVDIDLSHLGWFKRAFQTAHLKMGNDAATWTVVRRFIERELRQAGCAASNPQHP